MTHYEIRRDPVYTGPNESGWRTYKPGVLRYLIDGVEVAPDVWADSILSRPSNVPLPPQAVKLARAIRIARVSADLNARLA